MRSLTAAAGVARGLRGEEEGLEVAEGEPLELGELGYNVDPDPDPEPQDVEDAEYLEGAPEAGPDELYPGRSSRSQRGARTRPAGGVHGLDTSRPSSSRPAESPYALEIGATVPAAQRAAAAGLIGGIGPVKGSLLIFLIDDTTENRPLELKIGSAEGERRRSSSTSEGWALARSVCSWRFRCRDRLAGVLRGLFDDASAALPRRRSSSPP